jgi:NAD(P)-dependent dehydrogenase (short-subunit alcohol dehydrogenase family)
VVAVGRDARGLVDVEADARIAAGTTTPRARLRLAETPLALHPPCWRVALRGSTLIAPLHRSANGAYREVMCVNFGSAAFLLRAWIGAVQGVSGAAVFASSFVARIAVINHDAIATAKGGIEALVRSAATVYASQGLRINAFAPGLTDAEDRRHAGVPHHA